MIESEQVLKIIRDEVKWLGTEKIKLTDALNRTLASDAIADSDFPPFNKAAMDGFACLESDLEKILQITQEIPAGSIPSSALKSGECARIMTGAMMPQGADFVMMKEHAMEPEPGKVQRRVKSSNNNICIQGEDVKKGDVLLSAGTKIRAPEIAILASAGIICPDVFKWPSVGIISTGSELVEPDKIPGQGRIRNSNALQLMAQCMQYGIIPKYEGLYADDGELIFSALHEAIARHNLILISGGVSVGDYDLIPEIMQKLGARILFHGLKIKPGKHMLLGRINDTIIAGMPGNPVSSFVMFEIIVRSVLDQMTGGIRNSGFYVPLANKYFRKKSDVLGYIPVNIDRTGRAQLIDYHGSAHIQAYSFANAIMEIPLGINELKEGELVYVRPL